MKGRHALVTGAASGIGAATARRLRRDGIRVTALDLADPREVADDWIRHDLDGFGPLPELPSDLDVLVNAAGLPPRPGTQAKILRVNFLALRQLTLAVLPSMRPGGSVINVASKAGAQWRENIAQVRTLMARETGDDLEDFVASEGLDPVRAYDLSKEALVAWTKAMTGALIKRDLRMNAVSPAAIDTPILQDFERAFEARATRGIAMTGRPGRPEEVAAVIAFLASPASSWVRGCNIETDGGLSAMLETETIIDGH